MYFTNVLKIEFLLKIFSIRKKRKKTETNIKPFNTNLRGNISIETNSKNKSVAKKEAIKADIINISKNEILLIFKGTILLTVYRKRQTFKYLTNKSTYKYNKKSLK